MKQVQVWGKRAVRRGQRASDRRPVWLGMGEIRVEGEADWVSGASRRFTSRLLESPVKNQGTTAGRQFEPTRVNSDLELMLLKERGTTA